MRQLLKNAKYYLFASVFLWILCQTPSDPNLNPELAIVEIKIDSTVSVINGTFTDTIGAEISFSVLGNLPHLISACTLIIETDTMELLFSDSITSDTIIPYTFLTPGTKSVIASVTRKNGTVYSDTVYIRINGFEINITSQPENITDTVGKSVELKVEVTGSQPITYQWFKDGSSLDSATADNLIFESLKKEDNGSYYCEISNPMGSVSCSTVTVTAITPNTAPAFTDSLPDSLYTTFDDTTFSFTISATDIDYDSVFYFIDSTNLPAQCTVTVKDDSIKDTTSETDSSKNVLTTVFINIPKNNNGKFILVIGATDKEDTTLKPVTIRIIDRTVPDPVKISGKTPTSSARPTWVWGNSEGGNGVFKILIDSDDFSDSTKTTEDTSITPASAFSDGAHILYARVSDGNGNWSLTSSHTIFIDTKKPAAPEVTGSSTITNNQKPVWKWIGDESIVEFRYKMNSSILTIGATTTIATEYVPSDNLKDTMYTLYVQARDEAGNWSDAGSFTITVDTKAPAAPTVTGQVRTTSTKPIWSWIANGGGKNLFRCSLNSDKFDSSGFVTNALSYLSVENLAEGSYTLYVQEQDSAGNWSSSGSFTTIIDTTAPAAPVVTGTTPTNTLKPKWSWNKPEQSNGTFRYKIDSEDLTSGAITTTDTFYVPVIALIPGSHVLYVQAGDETGNWSKSGLFVITIDTLAPTAPTVQGSELTINSKPSWHWAIPFDAVKSRYKINSNDFSTGATETTDTIFTPESNLPEGNNTLYVQVSDEAGNWSASDSFKTEIDITPPQKPNVVGPSITNSSKPAWSWVSGGDGTGIYRIILDSDTISKDTSTSMYTSTKTLDEGKHYLFVQERDDAGNWSASGNCTTEVDLSAAAAPSVSGVTPTNTSKPTWTWKSGGGNISYRYKLDNSDLSSDATETGDSSFTPASALSEGNHILYVQESDGNGNWSAPGLFVITVDLTAPSAPAVTGTSPTNNKTPTWSWSSTGNGANKFRFNFNNVFNDQTAITTSKSYTAPSALAEGVHTIYVQESDEAGNWSASGSLSIRIDLTVPGGPTISGTTPTNNLKPTWSWTSTATDGNGTYRFNLDSDIFLRGATVTRSNNFTPKTDLTEGPHILYVQESDTAGNWSLSKSKTIVIDITPPSDPVFSSSIVTPTKDRTPTWIWSSGKGGVGKFKYKLDMGSWTDETSVTSYTFSSDQNEGDYTLSVQERDSSGNWSNIVSKTIKVDYTPPSAPIFVTSQTTTSPTTSFKPIWVWTSSGNTGAKIYRYYLDKTSSLSSETTATSYSATLSEGSHILYVQERDAANNWSDYTPHQIVVAPAIPTNVKVTTVSSSELTLSWTDNANTETGYEIYYSTDNVNFSRYVSVASNSTLCAIKGLTAAKIYYFKVRATGQYSSYSDFTSAAKGVTKVATPEFSFVKFIGTTLTNVIITCSTPSAKIYFTNNGTDPTTSSLIFPGAMPLNVGTPIKAIAVLSNYPQSAIAFTIVP